MLTLEGAFHGVVDAGLELAQGLPASLQGRGQDDRGAAVDWIRQELRTP
ncbi:hypothetical protein [Actinophytocola xinjiangensis]|nr:hypothetical protein [Actinophytocola xinjiangensis]